jgi:hypothetical protein
MNADRKCLKCEMPKMPKIKNRAFSPLPPYPSLLTLHGFYRDADERRSTQKNPDAPKRNKNPKENSFESLHFQLIHLTPHPPLPLKGGGSGRG